MSSATSDEGLSPRRNTPSELHKCRFGGGTSEAVRLLWCLYAGASALSRALAARSPCGRSAGSEWFDRPPARSEAVHPVLSATG